jgi:hypothetical protein
MPLSKRVFAFKVGARATRPRWNWCSAGGWRNARPREKNTLTTPPSDSVVWSGRSMSTESVAAAETAQPVGHAVFEKEKHLRFLQGCLRLLPSSYASQDPNRLTLLYFIVSSLDLFDALELLKDKPAIIDWIYSLQVLPDKDDPGALLFGAQYGAALLQRP